MGKKGTTVIPAVIKKMGGRAAVKSGPIKKINYKTKK
jgi:hypothetical protein